MKRYAYVSIAGVTIGLLTLAGCGGGFFQGERAPWRHDAEVACLKSGSVKLGDGAVQIEPIEGPGICGADFPLKVTALGESSPAMSYADDLRPPASIPNGGGRDMPRWPASAPRYMPPAPVNVEPIPPPIQRGNMRWITGPQPVNVPDRAPAGAPPMSITPPTGAEPEYARPAVQSRAPISAAPMRAVPMRAAPAQRAAPMGTAIDVPSRRMPNDIPDDAIIPPGGSAAVPDPRTRGAYNVPAYEPPPRENHELPSLGPARGPSSTAAIPMATLTPPAKLACPLVSALDRWVSEGVQPAALHWFGSPVVTIKQISAYSCRSMIGAGTNHISEHAFGNALDVAAFTLANGRTITVQHGWHGTPEEQGFLHDVQLYACETFTTVLAPGYNPEHYNHIHVDLMRRRPGYRPCRPNAVPGEVVAVRVRAHYASRQRGPLYTGSIGGKKSAREAVAGADGYVDDEDEADAVPLPSRRPKKIGVSEDRQVRNY
jgi:hypothetical protein